jgi:hypothetical protein
MYLYASEHALMDYHMNPEKAKVTEEVKEETSNETDTPQTE